MIIGVPKEILPEERRVAAIPETVEKYKQLGFEILVEQGAGEGIFVTDDAYQKAGARIIDDVEMLYSQADLILKVKQPYFNEKRGRQEVEMMRRGSSLITFLHPAAPSNHKMIKMLQEKDITSFTMDGIPRISRAQKMDALTSMSTISGYRSVLLAAERLPKFIPMIGTAIGVIQPAKVLIIGVGVVGLQAIATAKRLGGIVQAADIRENARKEAESLGAKAVGFEVPSELAIGEGGYAKALPPDWLEKERESLQPTVKEADIVILSALIPGEIAPILITEEMVSGMKPGAVIVDVSIDQGGNCAMTENAKIVIKHDVVICGLANIPGGMAVHASWLYANNLYYYVENLFNKGIGKFDFDDEIVKNSLVTHEGKLLFAGALKVMGLK
ncbi:MAG: NADP oxidoreductase [Phycisphaerae bacterium SM23_30]|nr:MAG: NADP oxidoreductase [Phycisphaerae bacterium SM23_30]